MIPQKSLVVPGVTRETLALTPEFLRTDKRVLRYYPIQMREEGGELAVADGGVNVKAIDSRAAALFTLGGEVYLSTTDGRLITLPATSGCTGLGTVNCVFGYHTAAGELKRYCATEDGVYLFEQRTKTLAADFGCDCGAYHNERLFLAKGNTIRYTNARETDNFSPTENDGGTLAIPDRLGKVIALLSFGRRLYAFCEKGIERIRADANDLNFRLEEVLYGGGNIRAGTVHDCGKVIVFVGERGLYAFNGGTCKLIREADPFVSLASPAAACSCAGKYYLSVSMENFPHLLFVYDPETDGSYFIETQADLIAGGDKVSFKRGTRLMELEGRGFPPYTYEAGIVAAVDFGGRTADSFLLHGTGAFALMAEIGGEVRAYTLKAEERFFLPHTERLGLVSFRLLCANAEYRFRSLEVGLREEGV